MADVDQGATAQSMEDRVVDALAGSLGLPSESTETEAESPAETQQEAEFAEVQWNGKSYQVHPDLKEALIHNADYTQKTQALAEQRKALDHVREIAEQAQSERAFQQAVSSENQELAVIDAYLAQAGKIDWSNMSVEQMFRQRAELDNVKERRQQLKDSISEKRNKFDNDLKSKIGELRAKAREMASRSITGFSEQTEKSVRAYASTEGLSEREIDNVLLDPRSFAILWKASQFDKVKASTGKAVAAAEKALRPGTASERMPAGTVAKLNFNKALRSAKTSGQKAQVIEQRLTGMFAAKG